MLWRQQNLSLSAAVITDGQSQTFAGDTATTLRTRQAAEDEKTKGVIVLAIGVGNGPNTNELRAMASEPKDSHWTRLGSFASLLRLSKALSESCVPEIPDGSSRTWGTVPPPSYVCHVASCWTVLITGADRHCELFAFASDRKWRWGRCKALQRLCTDGGGAYWTSVPAAPSSLTVNNALQHP